MENQHQHQPLFFESHKQESYHGKPLPTPSRLEHAQTIVARYWLWEILACLFSLTCFIAISVILQMTDGRELESWNLAIPPTATVSFLAGLAKAALVLVLAQSLSQLKWIHYQSNPQPLKDFRTFDDASRGPWGSAMLVFASRRWLGLATVASILTILALLVDPFVQLVFEFPTQPVIDIQQRAAFAKTQIWYPGKSGLNGVSGANTGINVTGTWTPNATWYAGESLSNDKIVLSNVPDDIWAGINNGFTGPIQPPVVTCGSGNCTWNEPIHSLGICGSCRDVTSSLKVECHQDFNDYNRCGYRFPSGTYRELYVAPYDWTILNASITSRDRTKPELVSFDALQLLVTREELNVTVPQARGWNCQLRWCEKTFDVQVVSGNPILRTIVETPLVEIGDTPDLASVEDEPAVLYNFKANSSTSQSMNYTIWQESDSQTSQWLSRVLEQQYASTNLIDSLRSNLTQWELGSTAIARSMAYSKDLNQTISRVAAVLTESIRRDENSTEVVGNTWVMKSFIRVRWAWMALPLGLLFLTCILFVSVAWKCHTVQVPIWKDDPVALLLYRIDGHEYARSMAAMMPQHVRAVADTLEVHSHSDEALALKTVSKVGRVGNSVTLIR